jgi:Ca-activated chloride channel family protein
MNTSRIPTNFMPTPLPTDKAREKSQRFGLFAVIESTRVILPLKGVECDFSVVSGIGEVSMTQIFRQDNAKPLDCEYLFPLPADASVYACEADINGRTIRAQVRERQEARQIAAERKAAGFRTALVEAERENLFTLSLGNVQPGDLVTIQLKYFQTLRHLAEMPSIEIPFCPGIRYIPGAPLLRSNKGKGVVDDTNEVPDASRITPVRIDGEHPDAAYIEVRGTLDGKFVNEQELSSPSHPIVVQRTGEQLRVSLSDKGDVPDRDFVLRWSEKRVDAVASRAWVREQDNETYALLEIRAPKDAPAERAPVDFYFLVDRSGSMQGEKWNKASEALQSCMKVLAPSDRAMVTFFETSFQDFAEGPLSVQELLGDRQFRKLKELGAGGGTEMRPALTHALEVAAKHSANRCKNLILITDAQVGNEASILELMKTAPNFPVHCFGIDVALNDSLLLALCRQQGGTFHSLNPNDDIEAAVTSLGKTLGQPVLLELKLADGWEAADAVIPNLYAGQIHYLSARSSHGQPLGLCARTATSEPVKIQFEQQAAPFAAPYLHWCRSRIQRLVAEGKASAAVALSVKSNLICPLTAFIAWDESEKVTIATHDLVQPSFELADQLCCLSAPARQFGRVAAPRARHGRFLGFEQYRVNRHEADAGAAEGLPPLRQAAVRDEVDMKRKLSDLCHQLGLADWQPLVKAIFDWVAEATGPERAQRLEKLNRLLEEIEALATVTDLLRASQPGQSDQIRDKIHRQLKEFVDALPAKK